MTPDPKHLTTAADVDVLVRAMFGASFDARFTRAAGLAQVVAVTPVAASGMHVLAIGPDAPKSSLDFFVLNLVRAWAEVILVGAEVLRSEPALSYDLSRAEGWGDTAGALAAWRGARGITAARRLVVLSRSGDVPLDHPVWSSVDAGEIHTGIEGRARLASSLAGTELELWSTESPGLARSVAHLRSRGAQRLSIEAGPGASAPLYADGPQVDTLLRSVYRGPVEPAALGPRFAAMDELSPSYLRQARHPSDDARWHFEWWTRAPGPG